MNRFNSLAPGKIERNFGPVFFKQMLVIDDWDITCEIVHRWIIHMLSYKKFRVMIAGAK